MLIVNNVVVIIFSHLIKLYGEKSPRVPVGVAFPPTV